MARRHWTLLVLSDEDTTVRQLRLSEKVIRLGIGTVLIVLCVLTTLAGGFFVKQSQSNRAKRLAKENELLVAELSTIRERIAELEGSLDDLAKKDEHYRLLAGLDPIDEEVYEAGIGGPGTATLTSSALYQLNPETGNEAFSAAYDLNAMIRRAQLLATSWREATESLEKERERLEAYPSILPTQGYLSSAFSLSRRHPILNRARPHEGIDIAAPQGTPILAAAKGRVTFAGRNGDYGLMVEIDHGHGLVTRYAHASKLVVKQGQMVERWQKIAEVGSTGLSSGPHLHYEVLQNGRAVNPKNFIYEADAIVD